MSRNRLWAVIGLLALFATAFVAAGCGDDDDDGGETTAASGDVQTLNEGTLFVGLTGRPGGCEAVRVAPSLSLLTPSPNVCAVAPQKLADALSKEDLAAIETIAASNPRRTFGQPRHDPGLVEVDVVDGKRVNPFLERGSHAVVPSDDPPRAPIEDDRLDRSEEPQRPSQR